MRLKKLMSLVLACAMALSLVTVASAADTKVYLIEDFSGYVDTDEQTAYQAFSSNFIKNYHVIAKNHGLNSGSKDPDKPLAELVSANSAATGAVYARTHWNDTSTMNIVNGKFYPSYNDNTNTDISGELIIVPKFQWDYNTTGETFVISYDYSGTPYDGIAADSDPNNVMANWANGTSLHFVSDDKSATEITHGTTPVLPEDLLVNNKFRIKMQGTHTKNNKSFEASNGTEYRIAMSLSKDTTGLKRNWVIDGASQHSYSSATTNTNFFAFAIGSYYKILESYDNIKMYTIKNDSFAAVVENGTNVPLNTKSIRIKLTNPVAPATYAAAVAETPIVVKADGVPMAEGTYNVDELKDYIGGVGGEIYSYVDITFDGLEEGTTYTVEFPETIANELGTQLGEKNVAEFTTKYPDVKVNSLTVVGAESLVADGSLQAAKLELANTTTANKAVAVIYAVYTTNGQLADIVYVNDEIAAEKTAEIEAGVQLNAEGTLKAFVWDGMTSLKPYTGAKELEIAAAAVAE